MAGFCIDESSFRHMDDLPNMVRQLNDQLSIIHNKHRQQVFRSSELDFVEVIRGVEFCNVLYNGSLGLLDNDERILLQQTINRCVVWDAEDFDIPDGDVVFNGTPTRSASILFVVVKALEKNAIGVVSPFPPEGCGLGSASVGKDSTDVFHVGLSSQLEPFYRFQMRFEEVSKVDFSKWVHLSFPRLRFALELESQLRRFREDYDKIRDEIVRHLAAVNDEFISLLIGGHQLSDACQRVKSACSVDISPESPNTHRNVGAMKEREVVFEGKKIVCEFHTKLTPTHDRIHFSPSIQMDNEKNSFLVVGPFAEHLTI